MPAWLKYLLSAVIGFGTSSLAVSTMPTPDNKPIPTDIVYLSGAVAAANALLNLRTQSPKKEEKF